MYIATSKLFKVQWDDGIKVHLVRIAKSDEDDYDGVNPNHEFIADEIVCEADEFDDLIKQYMSDGKIIEMKIMTYDEYEYHMSQYD